MPYQAKPLSLDPKSIKGISEKVLVSHYENNYVGAVKRLNAIGAQLAELDFAKAPNFMVNGLKREELIAANSMILHEIYFDGLGGGASRGLVCPGAISCGYVLRRLLYYFSWLGEPHLYSLLECHCLLDSRPGNSKVTASTPGYFASCCLSYWSLVICLVDECHRIQCLLAFIDSHDRSSYNGPGQDQ